MKTAQLSEEAKQVLKSHIGYRSEDTSEFSFVSSLLIFLIQK